MIDPSTVLEIAKIANQIREQVQKTKKLEPLAQDLVFRIDVIQTHLNRLQKVQDTATLDKSVVRLAEIMDDCLDYTRKIVKMPDIKKFFKAGDLTEKHDRLVQSLDSIIGDFNSALITFKIINDQEASQERAKYEAELTVHRNKFEHSLQAELTELQELAATVVSQGEVAFEELKKLGKKLEISFSDIKEKLDALHRCAYKEDSTLPPTIKITLLAAGARADEVVHETVLGVSMPPMNTPEGAKKDDMEMLKDLAVFSMNETKKSHSSAKKSNIQLTVLETNAYARLVRHRLLEAQPGALTLTTRQDASSSAAPLPSSVVVRDGINSPPQ